MKKSGLGNCNYCKRNTIPYRHGCGSGSAFILPPGSESRRESFSYKNWKKARKLLINAILFNFKSKFAQSSIVSYFRVIFYVFYDYRKFFMSYFLQNLSSWIRIRIHFTSWIRIRIQKNCWIRIRKKWMLIHSPAYRVCRLGRNRFCTQAQEKGAQWFAESNIMRVKFFCRTRLLGGSKNVILCFLAYTSMRDIMDGICTGYIKRLQFSIHSRMSLNQDILRDKADMHQCTRR